MLAIVLFLAFLLMPVLEIYVILQVGGLIGGWQTVALLLAESLLGAWIMRREGRRAWNALRQTFARGTLPDRELIDAALVLVGGALLLTPGFVTDIVGFLFVLPVTRPVLRGLLRAYAARRVRSAGQRVDTMFVPGMGDTGAPPYERKVIQGKIIRADGDGS